MIDAHDVHARDRCSSGVANRLYDNQVFAQSGFPAGRRQPVIG